MDQLIKFWSDNALWILIAGVVSLMGLIGFMFDAKRNKNKEVDNQDELGEPDAIITSDTVNILDQSQPEVPGVTPEVVVTTVADNVVEPVVESVTPEATSVEPTVTPETIETIETVEGVPTTAVVESAPEVVVETGSNMPDMSAFAYTMPTAPETAVVEEPVVIESAPEVVEPVIEEPAISVPDMNTFSYDAAPQPETSSNMPDMSAFAYTMPTTPETAVAEEPVVTESAPEVVEPVIEEPEKPII